MINYIKNEIGACKPVYDMYKATTVTICDNLLAPINAVWTSLGMALFFLLPALILSKCLMNHMNKDMYYMVNLPGTFRAKLEVTAKESGQ